MQDKKWKGRLVVKGTDIYTHMEAHEELKSWRHIVKLASATHCSLSFNVSLIGLSEKMKWTAFPRFTVHIVRQIDIN